MLSCRTAQPFSGLWVIKARNGAKQCRDKTSMQVDGFGHTNFSLYILIFS